MSSSIKDEKRGEGLPTFAIPDLTRTETPPGPHPDLMSGGGRTLTICDRNTQSANPHLMERWRAS